MEKKGKMGGVARLHAKIGRKNQQNGRHKFGVLKKRDAPVETGQTEEIGKREGTGNLWVFSGGCDSGSLIHWKKYKKNPGQLKRKNQNRGRTSKKKAPGTGGFWLRKYS